VKLVTLFWMVCSGCAFNAGQYRCKCISIWAPVQSSPCPLSLCSSTFTVCAATNFLMQPSQTARMEAWQQCAESAITLAAPTQPQEDTRPTALAMAKALRARVRQVWRLPWDNITGRKFGGAYSSMVWWEQGATDGP
jgi:hypothetical protein